MAATEIGGKSSNTNGTIVGETEGTRVGALVGVLDGVKEGDAVVGANMGRGVTCIGDPLFSPAPLSNTPLFSLTMSVVLLSFVSWKITHSAPKVIMVRSAMMTTMHSAFRLQPCFWILSLSLCLRFSFLSLGSSKSISMSRLAVGDAIAYPVCCRIVGDHETWRVIA